VTNWKPYEARANLVVLRKDGEDRPGDKRPMIAPKPAPDYEADARHWDYLATVMVWNEQACIDFRRLAAEAREKAGLG